jgi:hypothetical protein
MLKKAIQWIVIALLVTNLVVTAFGGIDLNVSFTFVAQSVQTNVDDAPANDAQPNTVHQNRHTACSEGSSGGSCGGG